MIRTWDSKPLYGLKTNLDTSLVYKSIFLLLMGSVLMGITNKPWEYMRNEGLHYQTSTKNIAFLVARFLHLLKVYKTLFYRTLCLNVRRIESLIPQFFHFFEAGWTEKDKIFNPSIHSSTRLFRRLSLHMWHGNISSLLAGLLKDQLKIFNVAQQIIACLCYESVENFVLLQISFEMIFYHCVPLQLTS